MLVERTTALKPLLAGHTREAERLRRPVNEAWNAIRRAGVFYHFVPKRYGGLEFDVETFVNAMLPLGEGCSSTGWVTSFCVEHNWMMSQFPEEAQAEIFGQYPYIIAPGVTQPPGKVTKVSGGYRLTGHWKWGTGVMHADWVLATGLDPDGGSSPAVLFFVLPVSDVRILDTWHVDGMIGTGSNDIVIEDAFIPGHRVLNFGHMREGRAPGALLHDNPIYKMPMLPFLALTAALPAVATARAAVEHFRARLAERVVFGTELKQAEKPAAQMRLALADVKTRTAELLVRDAGRKNVALGQSGKLAEVEERISLRIQIAYAMDLCRTAIRLACEASGSSAHFLDNPLQRALRDINVMSSHVVYDLDGASELHGRALIGLPPNSPVV
ncbi:MAG TPA: acyl-CoA dehydrogenase family protein [Rhizomicrobium sp.]|nr:acyl-CoA dehydrogenase family protein [Rhizomicrobium sp.]